MQSNIEKVISKINISEVISEYIDLQKKGRNFWALCPFHEDKNPSMSVSNEKKIFKCFVCGHGGNAINFVSDYEKISFSKALKKLADKVGVDVQVIEDIKKYNDAETKIIEATNKALLYFQYNLSIETGTIASEYLKKRNMSQKTIEKFKLGYSPQEGIKEFLVGKGINESTLINSSLINTYGRSFFKNRLIVPIFNKYNDVIGFSGRLLNGEGPKYINSGESRVFNKSEVFYNINNAYDQIQKTGEVFICEGFFDVIAMDEIGYVNSVAIMGTSLTNKHIPYLKNKKVTLFLDSDKAGINATTKSLKILLKNNIQTSVVYNKENKDPDELLKTYGKDKLIEIINNKVDGIRFIYSILKKEINPKGPKEIELFIKEFKQFTYSATPIEKSFYINNIAKDFKIDEGIVSEYFGRSIPKLDTFTVSDNGENNIKEINYSIVLIKSLLKSKDKEFKNYFVSKSNQIFFEDILLASISKYIIKVIKGTKDKPTLKMSKKVKEILDTDLELISTISDLDDVIEKINKKNNKKLIYEKIDKINNDTNEDKNLRRLETLRKLHKRRG